MIDYQTLKSGTDIRGCAMGENAVLTKETALCIGGAFITWLSERTGKNPEQLILTFAEIRLVQDGCPDWLLPKRNAYSYLDTGYLCVLAVCDDRSITDLPLDIDVSGLTRQQAIEKVSKNLEDTLNDHLELSYKNNVYYLEIEQIEARFDVEASVDLAIKIAKTNGE